MNERASVPEQCGVTSLPLKADIERNAMVRLTAVTLLCLGLMSPVRVASGQTPNPAAGHWVGSIEAGPGVAVEIDLASKTADVWHGTMSVPAQGARGIPLTDVSVKGNAVSFSIKGIPGDPRFTGTLAADGKSIKGELAQGGGTVPMTMSRTGDAVFEAPQKSTPITRELEGAWEGPLDVKGTVLRLALKLQNAPEGATGVMTSLDQGNAEMPVSSITQDGMKVKISVNMVSGVFEGELKESTLTGTWTQGPLSLPLVFKRVSK
jgi:hypothetical protein